MRLKKNKTCVKLKEQKNPTFKLFSSISVFFLGNPSEKLQSANRILTQKSSQERREESFRH